MMILVLRLMCGGFWMISYSIAIYKGIKEKKLCNAIFLIVFKYFLGDALF